MKAWKRVSKKTVFENPWRRLEDWRYQKPDGSEDNYTVSLTMSGDAVFIFPATADSIVYLLSQYFIIRDEWVDTFPAGYVDPGETPEEAAHRELREEAGVEAAELIHLGSSYHGKFVMGLAHFYLAKGCTKTAAQKLDSSELIEVQEVTLDHVRTLLKEKRFKDMYAELMAFKGMQELNAL